MNRAGSAFSERVEPSAVSRWQRDRLSRLLLTIYGRNRFYTRKFDAASVKPSELTFPDDLTRLPLTRKDELCADQAAHPPWGTALTDPERFTRYSQTSSTTGRPLRWCDTGASWQWVVDCWKEVYSAAHVVPADRVFFPFSFGPFLGFWAGFDAGCQLGLHCIPAGGMSSLVRLAMIEATSPTILCCTPTYALRLAEVARAEQPARSLPDSSVRLVIVAGEPGGSIPETRRRIEEQWGARVIDHYGLTEVGPVAFECWESPGFIHVNEREFIAEILNPDTGMPVPAGHSGELVLTNLGRDDCPVIRYRTGDIVEASSSPCPCGRPWLRLKGGVLTRADDMVNVKGVNVYPASIESVLGRFPEIVEFQSRVSSAGAMRSLSVDIEPLPGIAPEPVARAVSDRLREALGLAVQVRVADIGTLPRYEMKARRFVIEHASRE